MHRVQNQHAPGKAAHPGRTRRTRCGFMARTSPFQHHGSRHRMEADAAQKSGPWPRQPAAALLRRRGPADSIIFGGNDPAAPRRSRGHERSKGGRGHTGRRRQAAGRLGHHRQRRDRHRRGHVAQEGRAPSHRRRAEEGEEDQPFQLGTGHAVERANHIRGTGRMVGSGGLCGSSAEICT